MGLSSTNLHALRTFSPSALLQPTLTFFEFLKYETDDLRNEKVLDKSVLVERFFEISKRGGSPKKQVQLKRKDIKRDFEKFLKQLDQILIIKNEPDTISEIKWDKIIEICDLLRRIEKSDERKIRWAIYHIFNKGKQNISIKEIQTILEGFDIARLDKTVSKILKEEYLSGLDATFDGSILKINHDKSDKLVGHFLVDALEEESRRHPGELEEEILQLLDEGSYSNQEISKILSVDEAMVSRTISKLRNKNKLVLSSFGTKGARYYTTNCENCPFGKTIASCRKEALAYIITAFKEGYDIDLSTNDFEAIETNQALLQMKRIFMMAKKESNTKLERNLNETLTKLLTMIVDKTLEVKTQSKVTKIPDVKVEMRSTIRNLPSLYLMGLYKGAQSGIRLIDEILKLALASVKKEDRVKIRKHALNETNKFMKNLDIT